MSTLYSDELLAHARAPTHAALPEQPTATASLTNPLCGDEVEVGIRVRDGVFEAIGCTSEACAICVASASVMAQELTGQPIDGFERQFELLKGITEADPATALRPGSQLQMFAALAEFPSRKSCAVLPWRALERALHVGPPPTRVPIARERLQPEERNPWRTIRDLRAAGEGVALATLIAVEGSSPCPLGSRMIVSTTGDFWGSVSGGCVESAVVRSALTLLNGDDPEASQIERFTISNSQAGEVGLACGGQIRVHIAIAPNEAEIDALLAVQHHGGVRLVPLMGGPSRLLTREELRTRHDPLAKLGHSTFTQGPQLYEQGAAESWFIEPLCRPPRLVLVGATHIAQVLVRLASELGFAPVVVDPRAGLANRRRFPTARLVLERPEQALPSLLDRRAAVVMLSHDPKLDDPALRRALASEAFYVGALGSRKTQRARLERLRADGIEEAALRRLRGPAGLPIGGQGASEIALSILAEIVATRRAEPGQGGVGAVVLAAGSSRRAGPQNKLLHPFEGESMIRRVVNTVLEAGTPECVVVLGHDAERVRQALCDLPVTFVVNTSFAEGMGTSIRRGVEAIATTQVDATFIVLGDMPMLRAEDLETLRVAHCTSTRHLIIAPESGEGAARRLGNPVLWPRRYFDELQRLRGNQGAKSILLAASGAVLRIPIDHRGVLFDVDTLTP